MSKIFYKLMFLFGVLTITSCSDEFLKENPTVFVDPDALLVDRKGAETYLIGAYDAVQTSIGYAGPDGTSNIGWASHYGTIGADEVVIPGFAPDRKIIYLQQLTPTTNTVRAMWENLYISLGKVNSVIDRIGAMTPDQIDEADQQNFVAQAKFLRSTINFALVCTWENIPLIKNEVIDLSDKEALEVSQASTEEVYAFIIEDLKAAEAILPAEQGGGRVTKGAVQALLGKVYLQTTGFPLNKTENFALAAEKLKEVMDSGVYELFSDYPGIFELENEQSREMVFSIGMQGPGLNEGGILGTFFGPNGQTQFGGGFNTCFINVSFFASYDSNDIRLLNNIARHNANQETSPEQGMNDPSKWGNNPTQFKPWKWHAANPNAYVNDTPFDNPYIRYADVLLMYAEALNGQGTLTQPVINTTVNRLRARARMQPTAVPDMVLGTQEENATALLDERRKELCFEGWRRDDLIRFGKYREAIFVEQGAPNAGNPQLEYQDFEIRWPIPNSELVINPNLKQNPGY